MNSHYSKSRGKIAGNIQLYQITLLEDLRDHEAVSNGVFHFYRFSNSTAMNHDSSVIKQQRLTFYTILYGNENCKVVTKF